MMCEYCIRAVKSKMRLEQTKIAVASICYLFHRQLFRYQQPNPLSIPILVDTLSFLLLQQLLLQNCLTLYWFSNLFCHQAFRIQNIPVKVVIYNKEFKLLDNYNFSL